MTENADKNGIIFRKNNLSGLIIPSGLFILQNYDELTPRKLYIYLQTGGRRRIDNDFLFADLAIRIISDTRSDYCNRGI